MGNSQFIINGAVELDLTGDTVTADTLMKGVTAHDNAGNQIVGTHEDSGGGGVDTISVTPSANATSISFTGLQGEPTTFSVIATTQFTASATRCVVAITYNGTTTNGVYNYQQSNRTWGINYVSSSYFTFTYTNGTLKITTNSANNGGNFKSKVKYTLTYTY